MFPLFSAEICVLKNKVIIISLAFPVYEKKISVLSLATHSSFLYKYMLYGNHLLDLLFHWQSEN